MNIIILRKEIKKNEYRTPLIPSDCKKLINAGYSVFVESSDNRCFKDGEYYENGCEIIDNINRSDALIVGLKEFDYTNNKLFSLNHLYFSHCFKNQIGAELILKNFKKYGGTILDYEYMLDKNGKRLIAFGFWAGFAGMSLGLAQYLQKINNLPDLNNLHPIFNYYEIIKNFKKINFNNIKIAIIGVNGRCGLGCRYLLDKLNINFTGYTKNDPKNNLEEFDIIVNCIYLSPDFNGIFLNKENLYKFKNLKVIVDVSCDINAKNNPIKLDYNLTTFKEPIYKINDQIDIICIDNLPSFLPKDSSIEFSNKLTQLLLKGGKIWSELLELFYEKIGSNAAENALN